MTARLGSLVRLALMPSALVASLYADAVLGGCDCCESVTAAPTPPVHVSVTAELDGHALARSLASFMEGER